MALEKSTKSACTNQKRERMYLNERCVEVGREVREGCSDMLQCGVVNTGRRDTFKPQMGDILREILLASCIYRLSQNYAGKRCVSFDVAGAAAALDLAGVTDLLAPRQKSNARFAGSRKLAVDARCALCGGRT